MPKITDATNEQTPKKQVPLVNNGQEVKLSNDNVFQFLRSLVDKGYKSSKVLTIKDGSLLYRYFELLAGSMKPSGSDPTFPQIYQSILSAIAKANEDGAYDTNDAAVIDRLLTFVNENMAEKFGLSSDENDNEIEL